MIASTPIAQWNWGDRGHDTDLIHEAVRRFSATLEVLDRHRLGTPHRGQVSVKIPEPGHRSFLTQQEYPVTSALLDSIKESARTGDVGTVEMFTSCDGVLETEDGPVTTEGLFTVSVDVSESYFTVTLATFSDAWMQYDLKGKENDSLFRLNRPRLEELLKDISVALKTEVDPDDPSRLGIATDEGVENHFEDDGSASNVWIRFEIPQRNSTFSHTPPFQSTYKREATGRVSYLPVHGENKLLGYLWASDAEGAASFEPCDDADLAGYHAGLAWLEKLHEAFERGLTPSAALESFRDSPTDRTAGHIAGEPPTATDEFWVLRRMAGE
ncbi:hypothetical protein [Streptomyces sp. rh34]|uniref:hypothetical protein n=1 Tax=Streptomyces sp. rh34 TaxID=2034272 RepID=UPI00117F9C56|nr:hypothetical protein [Streptomyces sp. rh34]